MWRRLDVPDDRAGRGIDAMPMFLLRLLGRERPAAMDWKQYAIAMLVFNAALFVISFALLYAQPYLPFNPDGKGSLGAGGYTDAAGVAHPDADSGVVFNTVCSFVTNTNLQHYSGEQVFSYFTQLGVIVFLQFTTPAAGLAVMLASLRGLRGDRHLGDFYLDEIRGILFVLMPASLIVALMLVFCGMPMTFEGAAVARTAEGGTQTIARGPVAAEVAIKQLGTNGGGYFGPNSTHPYENPTPWSNLIEIVCIVLIPMASMVMAGLFLRNMRHALVLYGVMLALLIAGVVVAINAEVEPSAATAGLANVAVGPNLEGKEVRGGPVAGGDLGGVHHGHLQRLGGQHARQPQPARRPGADGPDDAQRRLQRHRGRLREHAVVCDHRRVHRRPDGRPDARIPRQEGGGEGGQAGDAGGVAPPAVDLRRHGALRGDETGRRSAPTRGRTASARSSTSSARRRPTTARASRAWPTTTRPGTSPPGSSCCSAGSRRLIFPLAIAGLLSQKKRVPETTGTLRTDNLTFAFMLLGTVILVGALSFMPTVVLGPIADHLTRDRGVS